VWSHREITHSLLFAVVVVVVLSLVGPWRAAVLGVVSHIRLNLLTGGVRLLVPLDSGLCRLTFSWVPVNALMLATAVAVLFAGPVATTHQAELRSILARTGLSPRSRPG